MSALWETPFATSKPERAMRASLIEAVGILYQAPFASAEEQR